MREQNINVKKVEFSDKNHDFGKHQEHSDTVVYVYNKKLFITNFLRITGTGSFLF